MCDETTLPWALVVEDEQILRDLFVAWLRLAGMTAYAVEDGQEALRWLQRPGAPSEQRGRPCVMLVDVNMPNLDGLALLRHLVQLPELARIPCVMMSGGHAGWAEEALALGAVGCLQKPFAQSALIAQLTPYCQHLSGAAAARD